MPGAALNVLGGNPQVDGAGAHSRGPQRAPGGGQLGDRLGERALVCGGLDLGVGEALA